MCSYDLDSFAEFIQSSGFRLVFAVDGKEIEALVANEEKLLAFSFRFLKQVLFGEMTLPLIEGVREKRMQVKKGCLAAKKTAGTGKMAGIAGRTKI